MVGKCEKILKREVRPLARAYADKAKELSRLQRKAERESGIHGIHGPEAMDLQNDLDGLHQGIQYAGWKLERIGQTIRKEYPGREVGPCKKPKITISFRH